MTLIQLIIGIIVVIILIRIVWGIINPFKCQCGYFTWSARSMLNHVEIKHQHRD